MYRPSGRGAKVDFAEVVVGTDGWFSAGHQCGYDLRQRSGFRAAPDTVTDSISLTATAAVVCLDIFTSHLSANGSTAWDSADRGPARLSTNDSTAWFSTNYGTARVSTICGTA